MAFADRLSAAVQRSGLTQPAAADLLGIKPRTLWDWLHGKVEPHRYTQRGSLEDLSAAGRAAAEGSADGKRRTKKRRGS